jgi:hypothetical protein
MTHLEFAQRYLKAVQKKHRVYFRAARMGIMKCVQIEGKKSITVHVTKTDLPVEIKHDIETMFWVG